MERISNIESSHAIKNEWLEPCHAHDRQEKHWFAKEEVGWWVEIVRMGGIGRVVQLRTPQNGKREKKRPFQHTHPHHLNQPSYPISSSSPNSTVPPARRLISLSLYIPKSANRILPCFTIEIAGVTNGRRGPIYCSSRAQSQVGLLCLMCSNFNNNILLKKF